MPAAYGGQFLAVILMQFSVKKIAVLGGGTAGWSAAALLAERYRKHKLDIVVIESPHISTVGVGEATVPAILSVHRNLKIDEKEFIKATQATFKLGIEFRDWNQTGGRFFHPFSAFGLKIEDVDFHQCWIRLLKAGIHHNLEDFSLCAGLAKAGRFAIPDNDSENPLVWHGYAYHFDASLYAQFLQAYSEKRGVKRISDTVTAVEMNKENNHIQKLRLESGEEVEADLFVDCSGFRSLLLEGQYKPGYEDWSHWLPCDRAVAVQTQSDGVMLPYTISTAMSAGWRWKIPLQNRTGNGYVYSSNYISDEQAQAGLLNTLGEPCITEPRIIKFKAGMRPKFWVKNCVAIGLASGFIEPLESTSISLMHTGVDKIIAVMPDLIVDEEKIKKANELNRLENERIRDFIILHYWSNKREDSQFWKDVRSVELPTSLRNKVNAFLKDGEITQYEQESFQEPSWLAMYNGFNLIPSANSEKAERLPTDQLAAFFERLKNAIMKGVEHAPTQAEFLRTVYE